MQITGKCITVITIAAVVLSCGYVISQDSETSRGLDEKVKKYLEQSERKWRDMNVSGSDGKVLYDLIVKNKYKRALEIGTSTGHSGIWIAWALSKTGGKLITIEIDKRRHEKALENFKAAGLGDIVDARLGDAHELTGKLEGPFDFVFVDADKSWYKKYLEMVLPKLEEGGCFTAHNVLNTSMYGIKEFLDYLESLPEMDTEIVESSGSGVSVSYKKKK